MQTDTLEPSKTTRFDQYEILCRENGSMFRLGQGPTSSSYKALDVNLHSPVVLKVIRAESLEDDTAKRRFLREARAAALLRHPNVAQIYRMGEENGACFYAREFVEGETLEAKVRREGPLELVLALRLTRQVADALAAVKEAGLVHRDIKPSNLMLTPRGDLKIIGFGLAKGNAGGEIAGVGLITMGGFVGSPDYASPEQLNEQEPDVSSDVYSLGVTLWFLLTGRLPFRGAQAHVMSDHMHTPPPFDELTELPPTVVSLPARMLEKDPANRPTSPAQLVTEIVGARNAVTTESLTLEKNRKLFELGILAHIVLLESQSRYDNARAQVQAKTDQLARTEVRVKEMAEQSALQKESVVTMPQDGLIWSIAGKPGAGVGRFAYDTTVAVPPPETRW